MTEKLYFADSHQTEAEATVLSCRQVEGGCLVELDATVLFPNGGGQPCDFGTIDGAHVRSVDEADGAILHLTDRPVPVGKRVPVRLDWPRRFDFMQQHTGEHLLSFAAWEMFSAANVGFHLAADYATIDLDKPLGREELTALTERTNRLVVQNKPVECAFCETEEEILRLPLRKHAEGLTTPIRIVSIPGADACTCCAPHCKRTGEVGSVLLADANPYKGGVRISFCCGMRAVRQAMADHGALDVLARGFSTARDQVPSAVKKQGEQLSSARREERRLSDELGAYQAKELLSRAERVNGIAVVVSAFSDMSPQRLTALSAMLAGQGRTLSVLFGSSCGQLSYVLSRAEDIPLDMGELCQAVNAITGGKGGGRGSRAQGMAKGFSGAAEDTVGQMRAYLLKRLGAK